MVCEAFGGGVFTYVSQLCNDMVDEFDVYLAYSLRPQTPKNYTDFLDQRVHLIEMENVGVKGLTNLKSDIAAIKELRQIEKDVQPDPSLISYFSMFAQLGIPTYGIRACAKVRDDKEELTRTTQELVIINFVMSVISYTALAVALMLVPRLREERALYIIVSLTIAFNVIGMEWMYKALEQYTYITIRSIIFKFVALIVMFVFVHQKSDYIFYGAITILAASGSNIFNFMQGFTKQRPFLRNGFIFDTDNVFTATVDFCGEGFLRQI